MPALKKMNTVFSGSPVVSDIVQFPDHKIDSLQSPNTLVHQHKPISFWENPLSANILKRSGKTCLLKNISFSLFA